MITILTSYVVTLVFFLGMDFVWLAWLAKPTYAAEMGGLLRQEPNLVAAAAFYLLYAAGLTLFAVNPGLKADSVLQAMALGAALGLVAYGTYDLTNLAVLNGYSMRIALIDIAWGTAASAAISALVVVTMRNIFPG
jgi:uncharacterized membrane protein